MSNIVRRSKTQTTLRHVTSHRQKVYLAKVGSSTGNVCKQTVSASWGGQRQLFTLRTEGALPWEGISGNSVYSIPLPPKTVSPKKPSIKKQAFKRQVVEGRGHSSAYKCWDPTSPRCHSECKKGRRQ